MKKLISFLKGIRLGQILTISLVSLLVFVGSAFGNGSGLQAQAQESAAEVKEEVPETGATSPLKGGINEFPDTDPRQDTSDADAKAESLVNRAEQNLTKDYELASPSAITERAQQDIKTVEQKAQQDIKTVGKAAKGAQKGMQNMRGKT